MSSLKNMDSLGHKNKKINHQFKTKNHECNYRNKKKTIG